MKPEREVEIKLWDWLKTKGSVKEVYFNSKNEVSAPVFKVKGIQKKPDLILKLEDNFGVKYCAVEVKDNSSSLNVLRANKIIHLYYKNYIEDKTKYIIEKEIKIDFFVIATQSSINGFLFKNENLEDNWAGKCGSKFEAAKKYEVIPRFEGVRTFDFIRILWSFYVNERDKYEEKVGLGILIGNSEDNFSPHLMITSFQKNKWGQRWWKI